MSILPDAEICDNPVVDEVVDALERAVAYSCPNNVFAEQETTALEVSNEAVRRLLERMLQKTADGFGDELTVDGKLYHRHLEGRGTYHSLCGPLRPWRSTYREVGVRNGPTVVPMELVAGIIEGATPALAYSVALGYGKHDMRSHVEDLEAAGRVPPSRTTLEEMAKRIGTEARRSARSIESRLRRGERVPDEATGAVVGLDRTTVPMEEVREGGQGPKTPRKERRKPYVRTPPPPVDVNWRMAYVGTFMLTDRDGEPVAIRRYTATPDEGPDQLLKRIMADLDNALRRDPALKVGVVQDAAPELWNLIRGALEQDPLVKRWDEGIDRFHAYKHLWNALTVVEPDDSERADTMERWKQMLEEKDCAIDVIEILLLEEYFKLPPRKASQLWEELVYIRNNKDRLRYRRLRRHGLPTASGVTEAACKSVLGWRTKGSGQRWHDEGLGGALTLRAIHRSDRLPRFWKPFSRRYTAKVAAVG